MNRLEALSAGLARQLWHQYLEDRILFVSPDVIDEQVTWIGTGRGELCLGPEDAARMLGAEFSEWNGHFRIIGEDYSARQLSSDIFLVFGKIRAREDASDRIVADMDTRFSAVFRYRDGKFSLLHLHHSVPNENQQEGEFFAKSITEQSNALLRAKISEKTAELERVSAESRANEARYRFALEATSDVVFEYDVAAGTVTANRALFMGGYDPAGARPEPSFPQVHPDDIERVRAIFRQEAPASLFPPHVKSLSAEYRTLDPEEQYVWVRTTVVPIRDPAGRLGRLIGSIKDIDSEKQREQEFKDKSRRDPLTGLYNKAYIESAVNRYIAKASGAAQGVLFAIDIDNFKAVNDDLGHLLGDAVLSDISSKVSQLFRSTDIVGRVGGDEFAVFLKGLTSEETLLEKAEALIKVFRCTFTGRNLDYKISGSIGISRFPRDGRSYRELFEKADNALYEAKSRGKDCCQVYSGSLPPVHYSNRQTPPDEPAAAGRPFAEHIAEYIFQILYDTDDISTATNLILGIVGRHFNVSRAYVFENSDDNLSCNNTFEWCNDGILSQIGNLQNVSYRQIGRYWEHFNGEGVFYLDDTSRLSHRGLCDLLAPQGIHSMLQCALKDDGVFRGYVGFDECNAQRFWTQEEIDTLAFISKILSTFLVKRRTQERLRQSYEITRSVLDHQDLWTYVIGNDHRLLLLNRKTQEFVPDAHVGDLCYEALWGRRSPCGVCPMRQLDETGAERCTMELYHKRLSSWMCATASRMDWSGGQNVCLMSCADITCYKEPAVPPECEPEKGAP